MLREHSADLQISLSVRDAGADRPTITGSYDKYYRGRIQGTSLQPFCAMRINSVVGVMALVSGALQPMAVGSPPLGGTAVEVSKSKVNEATKVVTDVGFCHFDAAHVYQNEEEVSKAIRENIADGTVKREDIFYTTKLWTTFHHLELFQSALERSLKALQLDCMDLFIICLPIAMKIMPKDANGEVILELVDLCDTWETMEKSKDAGLTKSIGVSSFNHKQLEMILNKPGFKYKPVCNQVTPLLLLAGPVEM
ncbi:aldo-keto reductase family 1 member C15-like [Lontra canadensis]|uniref:aldo-keto reductase family 1 member C15-like n=1 Tax=Lontra canadensis TaxID=76717 RepID=UPI0013F39542|nr:aldo-keto reductase family 1 member C15-like [Lontra canadensis]